MAALTLAVLTALAASAQAFQIYPRDRNVTCLQVIGTPADGALLNVQHCTANSTQWELASAGSTTVKVKGTNFCLDSGANPKNYDQAKIWTCYNNLPAQKWFYTDDRRIALQGTGFCLDLRTGNIGDGTPVQYWQCGDGNINQIWNTQ